MSLLTLLKKKTTVIAFLVIALGLFQGMVLRRIDYAHVPEPYVILDEHTNVWHGLSLRKTGIPTAWSILSAYRDGSAKYGSEGGVSGFNIERYTVTPTLFGYRNVKSPVISVFEMDLGMDNGKRHVPLVQPYLDHPPFGAIVLSMGVPNKISTFSELSTLDMRRTAVYMAVLTQLLIAVLAYQLTKKPFVALVASFAYATAPSFLLLSRYAQLENILTPLMLILLNLLVFVKEKRRDFGEGKVSSIIFLAGIIAGLAALTKLSGWISIILGAYLLYTWKFGRRKLLVFLIPSVFLGILYFVWGLYLNPRLFADLFLYQGITRGFIGSINLLTTMIKVGIMNFPLDGWWIGGFLSLLFLPRDENLSPLYASVVLVLASALILVGSNYPWYFIPLIPFLCVSIGIFFNGLLESPRLLNVLTLFFVFFSSSFYWGYGVYYASKEINNYQQPFMLYRILFLIFVAAAALLPVIGKMRNFKRIWAISIVILFFILVMFNHSGIYYIVNHWGKLPAIYTPGTFL